ncbi:hypothetical protein C5167_023644 [Papaver somniferum]|uniref:Uncharacterized protein n=1 Tax=Papaver somniferum TaxID=3469 RepID=A0A4Y7JPB6_PAPSO|nr:hypothetical protein C5167_023644 [Papaver somniferum]
MIDVDTAPALPIVVIGWSLTIAEAEIAGMGTIVSTDGEEESTAHSW